MTTPRIEGVSDPRFEPLRAAFADNFVNRNELGAGVAVCIDGRPVVELWAGHQDEARTMPWRRDTLVNAFSVGKGVTSLALLMLVDRGLVDLDAPVARYWPEFAAEDKGAITVRQLLCHQAGLPAVREPLAADAIYDWTTMTSALAATAPWWTPGARHGYHVNTFGYLVGEIIRRVSGHGVGTFLREELTGPADADFHIGVGEGDLSRIADFVWLPELAAVPELDLALLSEKQRLFYQTYFNPRGASGHGTINTREWRRAEIPSTNCHATALGVARAFTVVALGGEQGGRRYVSRAIVEEASREQSAGLDAILDKPTRFGLGVHVITNQHQHDGPLLRHKRHIGRAVFAQGAGHQAGLHQRH